MVLSYQEAVAHVVHTLGGDPHPSLPLQHILNGAGRFFYNHFPWQWTVGRSTRLSWRAPVTFTSTAWDEANLIMGTTLCSDPDYVVHEGDRIEITSGTDAKVGEVFEIESFVEGANMVLKTSPQTLGGTGAAFAGTTTFNYLELPSDFGSITAIDATDSLIREMNPTTLPHILELRTNPIEVTTWYFWVAVNHQVLDNGGVEPILEIWPDPNADEFGVVTIFYRATWNDVGDGGMIALPDFCQEYFIQFLRAFARGYEEEDEGTLDARLAVILKGPIGRAARRFDGAQAGNMWLGPILNGAIQMVSTPEQTPFARSPVAHPS